MIAYHFLVLRTYLLITSYMVYSVLNSSSAHFFLHDTAFAWRKRRSVAALKEDGWKK